MTECSKALFPFEAHFSRQVVAEFSGARLTTESWSLLLRQADRKIAFLRRVAACFSDYRQQERIIHEQPRQDPLLAVLTGKRDLGEPLAGKSTLNRLAGWFPCGGTLQQDHLLR